MTLLASSGTQGANGSKIEVWHTIVPSVVTLSAVLLIAVAIVVSMVKGNTTNVTSIYFDSTEKFSVYRGEHNKRAAVDQHNYYSDIPTSHTNNQVCNCNTHQLCNLKKDYYS